MINDTASLSWRVRACDAPNSGGRTPGSKLPASPPPLPRPDGGGTLAVYLLYTALKNKPVDECQLRILHSVLHCLDHPRHLSTQRQACEQRLQHQRCNCGNSTNFSTSAPKLLELHNNHRSPCQCTATEETRNGNLPVRHDRDVDDDDELQLRRLQSLLQA